MHAVDAAINHPNHIFSCSVANFTEKSHLSRIITELTAYSHNTNGMFMNILYFSVCAFVDRLMGKTLHANSSQNS